MTIAVLDWRNTVRTGTGRCIRGSDARVRANVPRPLKVSAAQQPSLFAHVPAPVKLVPCKCCAVRMGRAHHLARLFGLVAQSCSPNIQRILRCTFLASPSIDFNPLVRHCHAGQRVKMHACRGVRLMYCHALALAPTERFAVGCRMTSTHIEIYIKSRLSRGMVSCVWVAIVVPVQIV